MAERLARQLNFFALCMIVALALFIAGLSLDVRTLPWQLDSVSEDGTRVTVVFEQPPCVWATGPDVSEEGTFVEIRINMRSWAIPCSGEVRLRQATIRLDEPLGVRRLIGCERPDCLA